MQQSDAMRWYANASNAEKNETELVLGHKLGGYVASKFCRFREGVSYEQGKVIYVEVENGWQLS